MKLYTLVNQDSVLGYTFVFEYENRLLFVGDEMSSLELNNDEKRAYLLDDYLNVESYHPNLEMHLSNVILSMGYCFSETYWSCHFDITDNSAEREMTLVLGDFETYREHKLSDDGYLQPTLVSPTSKRCAELDLFKPVDLRLEVAIAIKALALQLSEFQRQSIH